VLKAPLKFIQPARCVSDIHIYRGWRGMSGNVGGRSPRCFFSVLSKREAGSQRWGPE